MIMMPLGPQFMRLFGIDPQAVRPAGVGRTRSPRRRAVSWRRSGSTASIASGRCSASTPASSSPPALCGFAPNYAALLAARVVAGAFGGVLGGLVFGIVADLVPYARRARRPRLSPRRFRWPRWRASPAHCGWPRGSRGARRSWSWRWPASRSRRWRCGCCRRCARTSMPEARAASAGPAARDLRRRQPPPGVRADDRADVRRLHRDPVHRPVQRRQRRHRRSRPRRHLLRRRARDAGHLAGHRLARRSPRQAAGVHRDRADLDRAAPGHHPPAAAAAARRRGAAPCCSSCSFRGASGRRWRWCRAASSRGCAAAS